MKYKEEAAEFNPNTHTMAFNVSKISSVQEALVLILHEEKHILDYYVDEGRGFFDELYDHVGIQDKDENGIGQNESCTERFAVDVAEEILGERIETRKMGRIHKLIQIAQNEIMQYVSKTDPNRIDEIKSGFIITAPEFELTEQDKIEFDSKYPKMDVVYSRKEHIADNSISNFLEFIREEVETEEGKNL